MSGSADTAGSVLLGPLAEGLRPGESPPGETARDRAKVTAPLALRTFSRLALAYGVSAAFASASAAIMSVPFASGEWQLAIAFVPFLISIMISTFVFMDLLEFLWDAVAGRFLGSVGSWTWLWGATLALLLVGMAALAAGIVATTVVAADPADNMYLAPTGIDYLAICGLSVLLAVVLPSLVLGPPLGRGLAIAAAGLGIFAMMAEAVVASSAPTGSDPYLGWMEGTFPLLNWNVGFGALVAASAFLIWQSYRFLLPAEGAAPVPA